MADREPAEHLGGQPSWDACGGHPAHMQTVPRRRPQGVVHEAPGSDLPQPGAPKEATDGSVMDHGEGDGGHTPAQVEVHKYWGEGDGGPAHLSPLGPPTNSGHPALVLGPPTGARPG